MGKAISIQMTQEGLLIPRDALGDLVTRELEAVRVGDEIVVRPKRASTEERNQVRRVLQAAGLLYEPAWETPPPVPAEERVRLAEKLARGHPLSECILADREDRI